MNVRVYSLVMFQKKAPIHIFYRNLNFQLHFTGVMDNGDTIHEKVIQILYEDYMARLIVLGCVCQYMAHFKCHENNRSMMIYDEQWFMAMSGLDWKAP